MSKATYSAAICGRDGNFGVVFPDFIGCVSAGDTLVEVTAMAHEALQLHVDGMIDDGDPLPVRSSPTLEQVAAMFDDPDDPTNEEWVGLIDVTVDVDIRNTIPLRVKADLVERIAELAAVTSTQIDSRQFIEDAVEHEIERYRKSAA